MDFCLGSKIYWQGRQCIVTNACIAMGKYIEISPIGNKNNPAKYYIVNTNVIQKIYGN
jgi:hypothetical protein